MPVEGRETRERAPPGYYSVISGRKKSKMAEGGQGDLQNLNKPKKSHSRAGSKKSGSVGGSELEQRLLDIEKESDVVENELDELKGRDAYSSVLHQKAMERKIDFIEDLEPPEELERDDIWDKVNADHMKEDEVLQERAKRLSRMGELMRIKSQLREQRLRLVQQEKELEMEEKFQQMETRGSWLEMQKKEYELQKKWQAQEEEYEQFLKMQSVEGWVAKTVAHVDTEQTVKKPANLSKSDNARLLEGKKLKEEVEMLKVKQNQPETGLRHLKKIGVLPSYGVDSAPRDASVKQLPTQVVKGTL